MRENVFVPTSRNQVCLFVLVYLFICLFACLLTKDLQNETMHIRASLLSLVYEISVILVYKFLGIVPISEYDMPLYRVTFNSR